MSNSNKTSRRGFVGSVAWGAAAPALSAGQPPSASATSAARDIAYPRVFTGSELAMISFPLGGVGAGSIGLGGRGQLRDWEIFNRPDKGAAPAYAFPSIWVRPQGAKPVARVLEARIAPPYEGQDGLGSRNAPGLSRLEGATFTGEFPLASIEFHDRRLPVEVRLEAGSPFIPLDAEESGLPVAVLRYRVKNRGRRAAAVSIAWSIENPVASAAPRKAADETRVNTLRTGAGMTGFNMTNPSLDAAHPMAGSFALAVLTGGSGRVTALRGWPAGPWWNSPLLFWDDFSDDGELGPEAAKIGPVGALCLHRDIAAGAEAEYTFLLGWRFPNRTPARCGWSAPKGHGDDIIGNWCAQRFPDAWAAAEYAASNLDALQARTRRFAQALRETTLPAAVKEAASANLSTLVSPTCFRTADGEFHGFEGVNDHVGCCPGNCTHVWNYETATSHLFPTLARSLRRAAFGYSMDERGAISFRQLLPDGVERTGAAAADGQMGQIVKAYLDWRLSGDPALLGDYWPKVKKALEFAWVPGGWDADRDGVMEGVQHNTYDVEFYGPNPLCGVYYLAALRAAAEMARAAGDPRSAAEYTRLFDNGAQWIDRNLFNGEYYVQRVRGFAADRIAKGLRLGAGAEDPEHPEYQLGDGCLVDQLVGQYLADAAGLGPLLAAGNIRKALESIYRYNRKGNLAEHDSVQRTFALNDEAALVICDYGRGSRPRIPFPYFAEVMTGFEYSAAALMLYHGMVDRGVECIAEIRRRYDGLRRNPWDEAECGRHYARAMASWTGLLALSGFRYDGPQRRVSIAPPVAPARFRSFWSAATAWGSFTLETSAGRTRLTLEPAEGSLEIHAVELAAAGGRVTAECAGAGLKAALSRQGQRASVSLESDFRLEPGRGLSLVLF
ncbi:MAG: hypothetical protein JSU00_13485 [Acidobacteria bacterium]|nr:hypothetical protein [Acidobacteriota bacterium]